MTADSACLPYVLQFQPTPKTLRPASVPQHYVRLMEGVQKAQLGIVRPWWKRVLGIW